MDDDDATRMRGLRTLRAPEFWLLLVATSAAALGLSAWLVIPLTIAGLSISSLPKYVELRPRVRKAGVEREGYITIALSLLNNFATSCAAFVLGILARWLWFG